MPFTPFHFGVHACVAFPLNKKLDIPVFILANVAIDIEPLLVITLNLFYPLHGYAHTFIGAILLGTLWGLIAFKCKYSLRRLMKFLKLPYETTLKKCIISGVLGALLHVLFDAPLYAEIKPFYPLSINPFYGLISNSSMYKLCTLLFVPALIFYVYSIIKFKNDKINKSS